MITVSGRRQDMDVLAEKAVEEAYGQAIARNLRYIEVAKGLYAFETTRTLEEIIQHAADGLGLSAVIN